MYVYSYVCMLYMCVLLYMYTHAGGTCMYISVHVRLYTDSCTGIYCISINVYGLLCI